MVWIPHACGIKVFAKTLAVTIITIMTTNNHYLNWPIIKT